MNVSLEDIRGCFRDPERPYASFPGGCPAPLKLSLPRIVFGELCGACPVQGEGVAEGREFSFYARYGTWEMEIESARRAHYRNFSGDDPWDGWMPPSVAFALITSKLLWHVCGPPRLIGDLSDWAGLSRLSDIFVVGLFTWALPKGHPGPAHEIVCALLRETERRGWPEGWWEDPSVVLEVKAPAGQARP